MRKLLTTLMVFVVLAGCDAQEQKDRIRSQVANSVSYNMVKLCLGGVGYYYMPVGQSAVLAPMYTPDGGVVACGGEQ